MEEITSHPGRWPQRPAAGKAGKEDNNDKNYYRHDKHRDYCMAPRPRARRQPGARHRSATEQGPRNPNAHQRATRRWIPRLWNSFRASLTDRRSRRLPRNCASAATPPTRKPHAPRH
ncbi:hypothetical protein RRG08_064322 [Elysia crispata]|uniref:Uncharacterized protein n=1 Tax=Elysia crispata TaxID=231223 RepID=A0AAE1A0V8_9GAST|nr:hypothetical protein RRG08_064322 [Elysia crispata]